MDYKTYTFHSDPSHGWLEVQKKELEELNIFNKVSEYSYINGDLVYLEEDCDANIFINAFKSKFGVNPKIYEPIKDNYEITSFRRFKKVL